ncbi:alpha-amylase family glycosyl hydrolase [Halalkalibacter krulwichiae]|uniref:alpha-amylase family glycosyl hydrolase n=1 Tax=Halalkalibacter krulwichiae TaxID=199441 RepID=UPI000826864F|nr:alpha-amylase family glycosyl hydrolase [Halalkalibacter krulwichiae]
MKRFSVLFLSMILLLIMFAPTFVQPVHGQWSGDADRYDSVVLRGSVDPLRWDGNDHSLLFNEEEGVWITEPISFVGGQKVEYKFVYDGEWMPGANLEYTIPQTGDYQFVFHPDEERLIDVRPATAYDGQVTLRVSVPEETPDWAALTVASSMNSFNYEVTRMTMEEDGLYSITLRGPAGEELRYRYGLGDAKYQEVRDHHRTVTFTEEENIVEDTVAAWTGIPIASNVNHDFHHSPFIPNEKDDVTVTVEVEHYGPITDGSIYFTTDGASPQGARGEAYVGQAVPMSVVSTDERGRGYVSVLEGKIPAQANETPVKYKVDIWNEEGEGSQFADTNSLVSTEATEFAYYVDEFTSPDWAKDAVIYHIFVDRFKDGNEKNNYDTVDVEEVGLEEALKGWMGGDLEGIIEKLDYLDELGVNTLYLSPVFEGPYSHGYHPMDFLDVDKNFGSLEVLKELIAKAHERDMKVVYDMVPNHSSSEHPFFQDALKNGENSPYYDYYTFYEDGSYETFYGVESLPQLNNDNQATRDWMLEEVIPFWLEEVDFDGYRLDYAKGPSYSFWVDFRHAVKQMDQDYFIFGEVWDSREKINSYSGKLDGALDFGFHDTFKQTFANNGSMKQVSNLLKENEATYHPEYVMTTFLDNHDVPRFLYEAGNDSNKLKLASFTQFTLPGAPMIYYGTEVGMSQSGNHHHYSDWKDRWYREMMIWNKEEQDPDLFAHYQDIIALRAEYSALRTGTFKEIFVNDDVLVFEREDQDARLLVFVNKGAEQTFDLAELYQQDRLTNARLKNVLTQERKPAKRGTIEVTVEEQGFEIFEVSGRLGGAWHAPRFVD